MVNEVVDNPQDHRPITVDEARQNKRQLEALKRQYDTAYQNFGTGQRSTQGGAAPGVGRFVREQQALPPAPSGWEDDWQYLTDEERQEIMEGLN